MPPASASTSPSTARPETPTSAPVASDRAGTAMPMPTQITGGSRRPWASAISPCHTGWVATSAVARPRVVSLALGTQVAKCAASATPGQHADKSRGAPRRHQPPQLARRRTQRPRPGRAPPPRARCARTRSPARVRPRTRSAARRTRWRPAPRRRRRTGRADRGRPGRVAKVARRIILTRHLLRTSDYSASVDCTGRECRLRSRSGLPSRIDTPYRPEADSSCPRTVLCFSISSAP